MSDVNSEPMTSVRLRTGTRSRVLKGRGIAVSAGASAVIVDGAGAQALWTAIEPSLRSGIEPQRLLAAVPEQGRDVVSGILTQLDENHLLRELEVPDDGVAAIAHLEAVARRPVAASRLVAATTLRVTGNGPVARAAAAHLAAAGYADIVDQVRTEPDVLARVERRGPDGGWEPVAFAVGDTRTVLVGPRNRDADAALEHEACAVLAGGPVPGAPGTETLLGTLVGAQLALVVLGSSARVADGTPPGRWPQYLVTTGGLVSEPRTLVGLRRLALDGRQVAVEGWAQVAGHDEHGDPAALDRLEPVWDTVLGGVGQPLPLDLPQLPVGLAAIIDDEGRACGGIGATTAAARLDVVLTALRPVAGDPTTGVSLGLGTSAEAARAEAVARLVDRSDLSWRSVQPDPADLGIDVRRLHAALTLQFAEPVTVAHAETATGLYRVEVRDMAGELLGRAVATGAGAAAHGALLRAAGRAQWATSAADLVPRNPHLDALDTRTSAVRTQLDAWARAAVAAGTVVIVVPDGADDWAGVGLHAALASWT